MGTFDRDTIELLTESLETLENGFSHLPPHSSTYDNDAARAALRAAAERMHDNYPYQHPLYVGQMLKPPHPAAHAAYAMAMYLNPNNHALDGGRASSRMEKEAVSEIAKMFGWSDCLGHLCGGGTMANFEALWVGRELHPEKAVAASSQAHYTHSRLSEVLGVPFMAIPVEADGRMSVTALEKQLETGRIGTVVVTLGTTAGGTIDPLPEVLRLRERHDFRLHVDSAYGGYFILASNLTESTAEAYASIRDADSIVIDPHKHGLQPYGCGCVLFKDPSVGRFYKHDSPYTYFSSDEMHLGEITLECSRAGASAVALWTTMRMLPLEPGGAFAVSLEACREAAIAMHVSLDADPRFAPLFVPELDIVVWAVAAETSSRSSALAERIFERAADHDLHLAVSSFPKNMCLGSNAVKEWDTDELRCLRACVMKPEHREWMPRLMERLDAAANDVLAAKNA